MAGSAAGEAATGKPGLLVFPGRQSGGRSHARNGGLAWSRLPFQVVTRQPEHPIMKGLPPVWMHTADELYATMRGPGKNMTVLATAHSDPKNKGTDQEEPMLMVLHYGKGRVFHTTMGHDVSALSCVGFTTTFQRGTEWAATGKVTQKVPANFPTAKRVSYRVDIAEMDPGDAEGCFDRSSGVKKRCGGRGFAMQPGPLDKSFDRLGQPPMQFRREAGSLRMIRELLCGAVDFRTGQQIGADPVDVARCLQCRRRARAPTG